MYRSKKHRLEFLKRHGWGKAKISTLAADASFRHYYRLESEGRTVVLMDASIDSDSVGPFVEMAQYLRDLGFSAPEVITDDTEEGFVLMEDLGDQKFNTLVTKSTNEEPFYERAIDVLCALHEKPTPSWLPPYDEDILLAEANLLIDWYWPALNDNCAPESARQSYQDAWAEVFSQIDFSPHVTVLRDYHSDNLMWLTNRHGISAVGLLDFQDALIGPPAYDVVSLLEDARRDVSRVLVEKMVHRYINRSNATSESFRETYNALGAQRSCKIVGIFTRLWKRDGKDSYLDLIPRVWRLLGQNLTEPRLQPVRNWFDHHIPVDLRVKPKQ